jgi:hypothetical protein
LGLFRFEGAGRWSHREQFQMIERVAAQPYNTGEVIVSGVNPSVIHWVQHYLNFRRQLCPLCIETNQRLRFSVRYVLAIAPATARNCQLAKQWWAKKPSKINKTSMRWYSVGITNSPQVTIYREGRT